MKRRPQVRADNYARVYDYYAHHRASTAMAHVTHRLAGIHLNTHVSFDPGAESQIGQALESGRRVMLAAHHVSLNDPRALAQLPLQSEACKLLLGNTFIGAKAGLFKYPILRHAVDNLGAVPVFRGKDVAKTKGASPTLARPAGAAFVKAGVAMLEAGLNGALFPGETRERYVPQTVPTLKHGMGAMVVRANIEQPLVSAIGVYYTDPSTVYLHLSKLSDGSFERPPEVTEWTRDNMQRSVYQAFAHASADRHGDIREMALRA